MRRLGGLASGKATLGDKSILFGRGFCMVAMWRMERIGTTGRAIKAAASQKGQSDGRILEESMYASAAANGAATATATATVTAAATDDEYGGASSRWAH